MQISISERVYEIGLRKSIGATDGAIFGQFLIESVSLSVVGGLAGTALGRGDHAAGRPGLPGRPGDLAGRARCWRPPSRSPSASRAGVYPALRASRLAPVDAIRAL